MTFDTGAFFFANNPIQTDNNILDMFDILVQLVQVTTTNLVKPTAVEFLADIGGSMGFWLGLGVLQVANIVVNVALSRCF